MNKGFWEEIKKPIMALAPMADVTDTAFRRIIAKYGKPDVFFTEFVSADGLLSSGREILLKDLIFTEAERPIVAQIFSANPSAIEEVSKMIAQLDFDGIDINMGCPDKSVEKQGAGASLIKNPLRAREIIVAAKKGAGSLPVSVKTRIGYNTDITREWVGELLKAEPAVIIIHGRTRKEMSKVPAHWESIKEAVEIAKDSETRIIGNGDVRSVEEAMQRIKETGVDGVMIGRGVLGNPWLFAQEKHLPTIEEKLKVMLEHTKLFEELVGETKNFAVMRKHYKAYTNGFDGAKELRVKLMDTKNYKEVQIVVNSFLIDKDKYK